MPTWRILATAVAGGLLAGCTLLVSTSGFSDGAADASEGGSGSGSDGSTATNDGGPSPEAGSDAAPAPPFCMSQSPPPLYCVDFDTGSSPDQIGDVTGAATLDATQAVSKPRSLLSIVEKNSGMPGASIKHALGLTPVVLTVGYDVFVEEYDATHDVELSTVPLSKGSGVLCTPQVAIRRGTFTFDEYCVDSGTTLVSLVHDSPVHVKIGAWSHVSFTVDFDKRTFGLTVDGAKLYEASPLNSAMFSGSASIYMGIYYLQTDAGRAKVYTDNVTVDAH